MHPIKSAVSRTVRVFWKAGLKFDRDYGFLLSAGIAFNLLICLVPLLLLMLSVLGTYLVSDQAVLHQIRRYVDSATPGLDPQFRETMSSLIQGREIFGILGIVGLIWASTWVFTSLRSALNIMMSVKEGRPFFRGMIVDLLMILVLFIFLLVSMGMTWAVSAIQSFTLPINISPALQWFLKYIAPFFFTFSLFFLIYKVIPNRPIHFATALKASLAASILWEMAKHLFGLYVLHLGQYSVVYGSLSTLAIFLLWIYYSCVILLLGGALSLVLETARTETSET